MRMSERYARNRETVSEAQQARLAQARVAVVGCGGLGGHVLEQLARIGVGHLTAVDGDVFEESNLNRQLLATTETLGCRKAEVARMHLAWVNPLVTVAAVPFRLDNTNASDILRGHQVVVDALDNRPSRMLVQDACAALDIPLVHGAIAGWYGQLAVILPGTRGLDVLYPMREASGTSPDRGIETKLGNPSFAPGLIASMQVAEVVKLLLDIPTPMAAQVMRVDLLEMEFLLFPIGNGDD